MVMIQEKVGVPVFHRIYHEAHEFTTGKREERKRRHVFEAIVDPEARARKKLKKNFAKRESRKRKVDNYRGIKTNKFSVKIAS